MDKPAKVRSRDGAGAAVRTRRAVLDLLKRDGPQDAAALARRLRVTAMAVRQHLYDLQARKMVSFHAEPRSVGRPAKIWRLTAGADRYFPDAHAELTVGLIAAMRDVFGGDGLDQLIEARKKQVIAGYRRQMPARGPLRDRIKALARLRSAEGYMAQVRRTGDGAWLLIENHCPICSAAAVCQGLCASEMEVFRQVLGPDVHLERLEHIQAGARRCAYRVAPVPRSPDPPVPDPAVAPGTFPMRD